VAVAGVPAVAPGGVVAVVAEVIGDLTLQRGLDQPLGQLGQQAPLPGQLQPALPGPPGKPGDQLLIDRIQPTGRRRTRRLLAETASKSTVCSGSTSVIGVRLLDRSYTVVFYSPVLVRLRWWS